MSKDSLLQTKFKTWHECVENIHKYPDAAKRLDTGDYPYSRDFEYLVTSIANPPIQQDEVDKAIERLKQRRRNMTTNELKKEIGTFIVYTPAMYKNADEARSYLEKNGWLPRPDSGKKEKPQPSQPAPEQPKPRTENNYQPKPRTENNYRQPKDNKGYNSSGSIIDDLYDQYERQQKTYKPSIFDKINDAFEEIRYRLDVVLKYLEQYTENIFYILFSILALAGVIYTFYTGHWVWGIIEIIVASLLGIYALAIGGALTKWFLKLIVIIIKYFFYRWWVPLMVAIIIGGGVTYKYVKEGWRPEFITQKVEQKQQEVEQNQQKTNTTAAAKDVPCTAPAKQGKKQVTSTQQGAPQTQQNKSKKQTTQKQQTPQKQQTSSAQKATNRQNSASKTSSTGTSQTTATTTTSRKQTEQSTAPAPRKTRYEQHIDAANGGDAAGCYVIAQCYLNGEGVAKDKSKAFHYMKKAADAGYSPAYIEVAKMYHGGRGVTKDRNEAERWYKKAADNGNAEAKRILLNM